MRFLIAIFQLFLTATAAEAQIKNEPRPKPPSITTLESKAAAPHADQEPGFFVGKLATGAIISSGSERPEFICSGTLISRSAVLTAGHCLVGDDEQLTDPNTLHVFFQTSGLYAVTEIAVKASYSPGGKDDIALLKLERAVAGVPSVALGEAEPDLGSKALIAGFGSAQAIYLKPDKEAVVNLRAGLTRAAEVTISRCREEEREGYLCFGSTERAEAGPAICAGDSGGGLFADDRLLGVASYSISKEDCGGRTKSIYVETSRHSNWIGRTLDRWREERPFPFAWSGPSCGEEFCQGANDILLGAVDYLLPYENRVRDFEFEHPKGADRRDR